MAVPALTRALSLQTIMEQFNPSLRTFIAMGKNYEKALAGVTYAAKGYFDALVKMGELASESQGSKELGDVLFQMAEVHRQIQNQLEETLKSFHNELLTQLEQKVELDSRYLSAALKKYQTEQRSRGDALDKCQAELKKLRKKSQGSKNPQKYSDKELQYIDAISSKQGDLENYVSDGYKTALTEERRRFCFLVEKQCAVAKNSAAYHSKVSCACRATSGARGRGCKDSGQARGCGASEASVGDRLGGVSSREGPHCQEPLWRPLSPQGHRLPCKGSLSGALFPIQHRQELEPSGTFWELRAGRGLRRLSAQENAPIMNGVSGPDGEDYSPWADRKGAQPKSSAPQQPQTKMSDSYSNTLPVRKSVAPKNSYAASKGSRPPRSWGARLTRVCMRVPHLGPGEAPSLISCLLHAPHWASALTPACALTRMEASGSWWTLTPAGPAHLLSFSLAHLCAQFRGRGHWDPGGCHPGRREQPLVTASSRAEPGVGRWGQARPRAGMSLSTARAHSLQPGKSSSTGNLLDKEDLALPPPDYGPSSRGFPTQTASTFKQRPYSMAVPAFSQVSVRSGPGLRGTLWADPRPGLGGWALSLSRLHLWTGRASGRSPVHAWDWQSCSTCRDTLDSVATGIASSHAEAGSTRGAALALPPRSPEPRTLPNGGVLARVSAD
ncbi:PREDICTED: brain-specific angiogenesis inhibitor 1-associated protein 2 [Myotis davidii]|uniref:brain-specific angiogenesis inhibitor 1-associated protein 2 n=1 Tax=Myotis davidii TaxID=225400 RepID=UPI00076745C4|nr:PREDICTED: brain-specific angiogenesis inhibitor 1-associated protein 2 [Myotis davidii]